MRLTTYDNDLDVALSNLSLEPIEALRLRDYWKERALQAERVLADNRAVCEQTIPVVITTVVDNSFAAKLQAAIDESKCGQMGIRLIDDLDTGSCYNYKHPEITGKPQNNSGKSKSQGYAETTQANAQSVSEKPKAQDTLKRKPVRWHHINSDYATTMFMGVELTAFKDADGTYNASCVVPVIRPEFAKNFVTLDDAKQYAETVMLGRVFKQYFEKG